MVKIKVPFSLYTTKVQCACDIQSCDNLTFKNIYFYACIFMNVHTSSTLTILLECTLYMCIHINLCIIYMYMCMCLCIWCLCVFVCLCMCMHAWACVYTYVYICVFVHVCVSQLFIFIIQTCVFVEGHVFRCTLLCKFCHQHFVAFFFLLLL